MPGEECVTVSIATKPQKRIHEQKYRVFLAFVTITVVDSIFRERATEYNARHEGGRNRRRAKMMPFRGRNRITHAAVSASLVVNVGKMSGRIFLSWPRGRIREQSERAKSQAHVPSRHLLTMACARRITRHAYKSIAPGGELRTQLGTAIKKGPTAVSWHIRYKNRSKTFKPTGTNTLRQYTNAKIIKTIWKCRCRDTNWVHAAYTHYTSAWLIIISSFYTRETNVA